MQERSKLGSHGMLTMTLTTYSIYLHFASNFKYQAKATKKMSIALQCATMNKILEPKSAFDVPPVSTGINFKFRLKLDSHFLCQMSGIATTCKILPKEKFGA